MSVGHIVCCDSWMYSAFVNITTGCLNWNILHYYVAKALKCARIYTCNKLWTYFNGVTLLSRSFLRHLVEHHNDVISVWISCSCQKYYWDHSPPCDPQNALTCCKVCQPGLWYKISVRNRGVTFARSRIKCEVFHRQWYHPVFWNFALVVVM
jgi:hypothetical protein